MSQVVDVQHRSAVISLDARALISRDSGLDIARPYRTIGYPVLPALYIALTTDVMLLILMSPSSRQDAFFGLAIVVVGIPVYFIWRSVEPRA